FVKRVIALAGDTLEIRCNVVYVNGHALPHELVDAKDTYEDFHEDSWYPVDVGRYRETIDGKTYEIFQAPEAPTPDTGDIDDFPYERAPSCSAPRPPTRPRQAPNQLAGTIVGGARPTSACTPFRHYVVPEGHVFVLGDNRGN